MKTSGRRVVLAVIAGAFALALVGAWFAKPVLRHPIVLWELWREAPPEFLPVPVEGVRARRLADTWGGIRSEGRHHQGVDIFASRGTPVRSATRGVVARVGVVYRGGNAVDVIGPGLWRHYYAHLDRFGDVHPGDVIEKGRVIGYVGDTGNAKGTPFHLHYGVYLPGTGAINPWPLLRDDANREGAESKTETRSVTLLWG